MFLMPGDEQVNVEKPSDRYISINNTSKIIFPRQELFQKLPLKFTKTSAACVRGATQITETLPSDLI
jgi:hypothetical protein